MTAVIPAHRPDLGALELAAVARVFESGWLGQGPVVEAFEDALRHRLGVAHVVAVSSGTAALHLALEALQLPPGSGVVVPSFTFVATIQAIVAARLCPVFCEVDEATLHLDLADVAACLAGGVASEAPVRAVLPVHFGGAPCDMDALCALAAKAGLRVVEDAAHAFGSTAGGRAVGTAGDIGCFSFDPIKTITCGEGGAVVTADADLAQRVRAARMLGIEADGWQRHTGRAAWRYDVPRQGWRYHMADLNAAIGLTQLTQLEAFRHRRQQIVQAYAEGLHDVTWLVPVMPPSADICPFTYTVRVGEGRRDALLDWLRDRGIRAAVEYIPNHLHGAFRACHRPLPVTERLFGEVLSLPLHTTLEDADVAAVIDAVRAFGEEHVGA